MNTEEMPVPSIYDSVLQKVIKWIKPLSAEVMGQKVGFIVSRDKKQMNSGRIYIQCEYKCANLCKKGHPLELFRGRKWYISDYMTEDEVVKTCYAAFKATVEHEVMEGFHYKGQRVFNPHADFRSLMEAGKKQVFRAEK